MIPAVRITRVICPSCRGTGQWLLSAVLDRSEACMWCAGQKRVAARVARRYADDLYSIAVGGYICGDHDIKTRDQMTEEAVAIFGLLGEVPPWIAAACAKPASSGEVQ